MKKIFAIVLTLLIVSCGKQEEIKTTKNSPIVEKQIVATGSSWKLEKISTWTISEEGTIYTKDFWEGFIISQTKKITTLSFSWKVIFSKTNNEDNQISGGGTDILCGTWIFISSLNLTQQELDQCELDQNRLYFSVDTKNKYLDRFFVIRKDVYNPWRNSFLFDTRSNKTYQIASKNILQFTEWRKWYYLLTWIDQFDGENQLSFLSHDGSFIDQINDSELNTTMDKFEIQENGDIKIFYQNQTRIIPLKLK